MEQKTTSGRSREPGGVLLDGSFGVTSWPFVGALAVLLLNDRVLKPAIGNWFTGKLSDFAGLFAFSLFLAVLLPSRRRAVFALAAMMWMLWKSALSNPVIVAWNALGVLPLARVVDYSDWLALIALIPAFRLATAKTPRLPASTRKRPLVQRRIAAILSAMVAMFAFSATSYVPPGTTVPIADANSFTFNAPRVQVQQGMKSLGFYLYEQPLKKVTTTVDTLVVYIRQPPERPVRVRVELRELSYIETDVTVLAVTAHGPPPQAEPVLRAFEQQLVQPLREWLANASRATRDST